MEEYNFSYKVSIIRANKPKLETSGKILVISEDIGNELVKNIASLRQRMIGPYLETIVTTHYIDPPRPKYGY